MAEENETREALRGAIQSALGGPATTGEVEVPPTSVEAQETVADQTPSESIPAERFEQVIGQRNEAREENTRLTQELATLRDDKANAEIVEAVQAEVQKGQNGDLAQVIFDAVEQIVDKRIGNVDLASLAETSDRLGLADHLPGLNKEQAGAIRDLQKTSPDLTPPEAAMWAKVRNPSLFPEEDRRGFQPGVHSSTIPSGASPTRQPPQEQKLPTREEVKAMPQGPEKRQAVRALLRERFSRKQS